MTKFMVSLLAVLLVSGVAFAQDEDFVEGDHGAPDNSESEIDRRMGIEQPKFRGGGCRPEEVSSALSPDKKILSVLFDNYSVTAGGSTGINRNRKACDIAVPFVVPEGFRVTVVKLDFRGFNALPNGARTQLITSYSYGALRGDPARGGQVTRRALFRGPLQEDFFVSSRIRPRDQIGRRLDRLKWSQCGSNFDLHVGVSVVTQTNARSEESTTIIDSVDLGTHVEYALLWQRCDVRPERPERPRDPRNRSI